MIRKLLLIAAILVSGVFYVSATSFHITGVFDNDGYVFTDNSIQKNLYGDNNEENDVVAVKVNANDNIYTRWGTEYFGETLKQEMNTKYPMILKDGTAIQFMEAGNVLFDVTLREFEDYAGLIIADGEAYNSDYTRANANEYVLTRLVNNLYINTQKMVVTTSTENYEVKSNSFLYLSDEYIRDYQFFNGKLVGYNINGLDENATIKIGGLEISYGDLLLKLGETAVVEEQPEKPGIGENEKEDEEVKEEQEENNPSENEGVNESDTDKNGKNDGTDSNKNNNSSNKNDELYQMVATVDNKELIYNGEPQGYGIRVTTTENIPATIYYGYSQTNCYSTDILKFTDAGDYTVYYVVKADKHIDLKGSYTLTINKREVLFSGPSIIKTELNYDGTEKTLAIEGGSSKGGTMFYKIVDSGDPRPQFNKNTWQTSLETRTDIGMYDIYYYCYVEDTNNNTGTDINTVLKAGSKSIGLAISSVEAQDQSYIYDGLPHGNPIEVSTVNNIPATVRYGFTEGNYNLSQVPQITNVGESKTIYYEVTAEDHQPVTGSYNLVIKKRTVKIVPPRPVRESYYYTGELFTLATVGSCSEGGEMYYFMTKDSTIPPEFNENTWKDEFDQQYDPGMYRIYYYCKVDDTNNNTGDRINEVVYAGYKEISGRKPVVPPRPPKDPTYTEPIVRFIGPLDYGVKYVRLHLDVYDPAAVIKTGISVELRKYDEATDSYYLLRSSMASSPTGETFVIFSNLTPNTKYKINAYYYYYTDLPTLTNQVEYVDIMEQEFSTLDISELGTVYFDDFRMEEAYYYSDKVVIPFVHFTQSGEFESSMDAIASINSIEIDLTDVSTLNTNDEKTYAWRLTPYEINKIIQSDGVSYSISKYILFNSDNNTTREYPLPSNTQFAGKIRAFDVYGNEISTGNNTFVTRTTKAFPVGKLTNPIVNNNVLKIQLDSFENVDDMNWQNLRIEVTDSSKTQVIASFPLANSPADEIDYSQKVLSEGLSDGKTYAVRLVADLDLNENGSYEAREIYSKNFETADLSSYGDLYLTVGNVSSNYLNDRDMANRAFISFYVNRAKTNLDLLERIGSLTVTMRSSDGRHLIEYTFDNEPGENGEQSELEKLLAGSTVVIDTNDFTNVSGSALNTVKLNSNSTYSLSAKSTAKENAGSIGVVLSTSTFRTPKTPVSISMTKENYYEGFITADIALEDIDGVITSDKVVLRVYELTETGGVTKQTLVGSFRFGKLETYNLKMFADPASSCDGNSYNIKANTKYKFVFVAEKATPVATVIENYELATLEKTTQNGITGEVYLGEIATSDYKGNDPVKSGPDAGRTLTQLGYTQLEYIEATGAQYIDSLYVPTLTTSVNLKWLSTNIVPTQMIIGTRWTSYSMTLMMHAQRYYYYSNGITTPQPSLFEPDEISFNTSSQSFIVNGIKYNNKKDNLQNLQNYSLKICGYTNNYYSHGKLYYLNIMDNGTPAREYVPVKKTLENGDIAVGLFDIVEGKFYQSKTATSFVAGPEKEKSVIDFDKNTQMLATLKVAVNDNLHMQDNEVVYLKAFRKDENGRLTEDVCLYTFDDGATVDLNNISIYYNNPEYLQSSTVRVIDSNGRERDLPNLVSFKDGKISVTYPVEIVQNTNKSYVFKLIFQFGDEDDLMELVLDTSEFTTEQEITAISTMDEFLAIGGSSRKYIVVKDLYYSPSLVGADSNTPWYNGFNATVDFQGHSLNYSGCGSVIYQMNREAKISNIVFNNTITTPYVTSEVLGVGNLVYNNYGTIENIVMNYAEDMDIPYRYDEYWTTAPATSSDVTKYKYKMAGGISFNNYGTISNFVVRCATDVTVQKYAGLVAYQARAGSVIRNGYIYSTKNLDVTGTNYKVQINVYGTDTSSFYGSVIGRVDSNTITENVYSLADINMLSRTTNYSYCGVLTGYSQGIIRNSYAVGNTTYNSGSLNNYVGVANYYGSAIGSQYNSLNQNTFYISSYSYRDSSYNVMATLLSLKSKVWQNGVLNNGNGSFNVDDMVDVNCYPQVNFTSNYMPIQDRLFLSFEDTTSKVDVIFSYEYILNKPNADAELEELYKKYVTENKDNYIVWTSDPSRDVTFEDIVDGNGNPIPIHSDVVPMVIQISDKQAVPIKEITVNNLSTKVLAYNFNGEGITTVYCIVYNPLYSYSNFEITNIRRGDATFTDNKSITGRYLQPNYYKTISTPAEWLEYLHNGTENSLKQNYVLTNDIDFSTYTVSGRRPNMEDVFVPDTYKGIFDGNDFTIKGIDFVNFDPSSVYVQTPDKSIGLFSILSGTVKNLKIDGVSFEGGKNAGVLAGETTIGSIVDSVYVTNSYVAGGNNVGGLIGYAGMTTDIRNCGVSDTRLMTTGLTSEKNVYNYASGGLVGSVGGIVSIDTCYVQNIYIETFYVDELSYAGGILGANILGPYTSITNSYATGVICGAADALGGIVGYAYRTTVVDNCYSDVNIDTYNGNAGGIMAKWSGEKQYVTNCVSFGSISSGNIVEEDDKRLVSNNFVSSDYATVWSNNAYYNGAFIDSRYIKDGRVLSKSYDEALGDAIDYINWSSYLDNDYYFFDEEDSLNEYLLPLLHSVTVDPNTQERVIKLLPGQKKTYIADNITGTSDVSPVQLVNYGYGNNTLSFRIRRMNNVTIDAIYTDYTFANEQLPVSDNQVDSFMNSFTKHQAFNVDYSSLNAGYGSCLGTACKVIDQEYYYSNVAIENYYDLYKVTAIKYTVNYDDKPSETNYLYVNRIIDGISMQYRTINSVDGWINNFADGSYMENIRLNNSLDFSGRNLYFNNESGANVLVNRLIGNCSGFTDEPSNTNVPSIKISNVTINANNTSGKKWVYDGFGGLVRVSATEIANITFDNINISRGGSIGVIANMFGDAHDLAFINCSISGTALKGNIGSIAVADGALTNIYVGNSKFTTNYGKVGSVAGIVPSGRIHIDIYNVVVENVYVDNNGNNAYTGGVVGSIFSNGYTFNTITWRDSIISPRFKYIIVRNSNITSDGERTGGIFGNIHLGAYVDDCSVLNSNISSTGNYVAGISGRDNSNAVSFVNCHVGDSKILGTRYVSGLVSYYGVYFEYNTVENCEIIATDSYAGGLAAFVNHWRNTDKSQDTFNSEFTWGWVIDSTIMGNENVGGLVGYTNNSIDNIGFVDNSVIRGNKNVGGAVGYCNGNWIGTPYVSNTIITTIENNSYGIPVRTYAQEYFGGLIGYGGKASGFVDNCVIGAGKVSTTENKIVSTVNYVGALQGFMGNIKARNSNELQYQGNAIARDSVVVGNNYIGGMFGSVSPMADTSLLSGENYSNAYVIGNDYVAGLAGYVSAYRFDKDIGGVKYASFTQMPMFEYSYFTGEVQANVNASAMFGLVAGLRDGLNTLLPDIKLRLAGLVSMPIKISGQYVEPVLFDGTQYQYNWADLLAETSDLKLSFWADTQVSMTSNPNITKMYVASGDTAAGLLNSSKYINNVGSMSEVSADFTAGAKTNRKFIYAYTNVDDTSMLNNHYRGNALIKTGENAGKTLADLGYVQVEYLQSTGTQYIDTGYTPNANTRIELAWQQDAANIGKSQAITGTGSWSAYSMMFVVNNSRYKYYSNGIDTTVTPSTDKPDIISFSTAANSLRINGGVYQHATDSLSGKNNTLYLFSTARNYYYYAYGKLYYCDIYEGNGLVREFVPVKTDGENPVYGLFDMVEGRFYPCSRQNYSFTGGPELNPSGPETEAADIINNIISFSLSGNKSLVTTIDWAYNSDIIARKEMPYLANLGGIGWYGYTYSTGANNENYLKTLTVTQGVPIPSLNEGSKFVKAAQKMRLVYSGYLNGEFGNGLISNVTANVLDSVYASGVDTLNIDCEEFKVGYTRLEYIESTGTQFINTGYTANADTRVEMGWQSTSNAGNQVVLGSVWANNSMMVSVRGGYWYSQGNSVRGPKASMASCDRVEYSTAEKSMVVNGTLVNNAQDTLTSKDQTLKVFGINNYMAYGRLYYLRLYEGDNLVRDFIPVMSPDGEIGLLDMVDNKFYGNSGTDSFVPGTGVYQGNTITVTDEAGNILLDTNRGSSTLTMKYDFNTQLKVTVNNLSSGQPVVYTVNPVDVAYRASLYGNDYYYIKDDGTVYKNNGGQLGSGFIHIYNNLGITETGTIRNLDTDSTSSIQYYYLKEEAGSKYAYNSTSNTRVMEQPFEYIYDHYAIDSNGTLWDLSTAAQADYSVNGKIPVDAKYLYSGDINSSTFKTFGSYSLVESTFEIKKNPYRYYSKDGSLVVLKDNSGAVPDGVFISNYSKNIDGNNVTFNYEAFLNKNGNLKSIGESDLLELFENANIPTSNIKAVTSNIDTGITDNKKIILTYNDGGMIGYNVDTGEKFLNLEGHLVGGISMFGLESEGEGEPGLMSAMFSFVSDSFGSLFSFRPMSLSMQRSSANSVVNTMNETGLSLNDIVDYSSEDEGFIGEVVDGEGEVSIGIEGGNQIPEIGIGQGNEQPEEYDEDNKSSIIFAEPQLKELVGDLPYISGVTDGTSVVENEEKFIDDTKADDEKFIAIYDGEKDDFDIYSKEELVSSEEPVAENTKVVSQSKLKALYEAIGQKDRDKQHGYVLYVLVAMAIVLSVSIIVLFDYKKNKL